jgi:peptidoglycan-associated lipoprotein
MNNHKNLLLVIAGSLLLALGGCSTKKVKPVVPTTPVTSNGAQSSGAGNGSNGVTTVNAGGQAAAGQTSAPVGVERILYFDFDSSEIKPEYVAPIAAHARTLSANASIRVRLEGHTDERGSPEYNIGLGERRAQAVRRALLLQGVGEGQVSTVSYGEERPAAPGQTEEAWSRNRRVEIVYLN